jgi:hypothetical protein
MVNASAKVAVSLMLVICSLVCTIDFNNMVLPPD